MNEMLNSAQEGHSAEYIRDRERDEQRTDAILDNYLGIYPTHPNCYASIHVEEAFDWDMAYERIIEEYELPIDSDLYVFTFHSQPNVDRDIAGLDQADLAAFRATRDLKPKDFLYYYREGIIDQNGNVLSFCVWTDPSHASVLKNSPDHEHAAQYAHSSYVAAHTQWWRMSRENKGSGVAISPFKPGHTLSVGNVKKH